jgi:hypothetical protein
MKALKVTWLASGQMASKHLQVAIPLWLPQYEKTYGAIADDVRYLLLAMLPRWIVFQRVSELL